MKSHLEKAQGALAEAAGMNIELGAKALPDKFKDLLMIATVQAHVASAEAMTRIADALDSCMGSIYSGQAKQRYIKTGSPK